MNDQEILIEWDDFDPNQFAPPWNKWVITNIKCPNCSARLHRFDGIVLCTNPPKYKYSCFECGWFGLK